MNQDPIHESRYIYFDSLMMRNKKRSRKENSTKEDKEERRKKNGEWRRMENGEKKTKNKKVDVTQSLLQVK